MNRCAASDRPSSSRRRSCCRGAISGNGAQRSEPAAAIAAINARRPRATIELAVEPQGANAIVDVHVKVPDVRDRSHAAGCRRAGTEQAFQRRQGRRECRQAAHRTIMSCGSGATGLPWTLRARCANDCNFALPADRRTARDRRVRGRRRGTATCCRRLRCRCARVPDVRLNATLQTKLR